MWKKIYVEFFLDKEMMMILIIKFETNFSYSWKRTLIRKIGVICIFTMT